MPLSLTGLRTRLRERVDRAARGTDVPAGIDRDGDGTGATGSRERGRMRRRLRELRRLREAQLLELGALVLEAHRHDRDDSPVIKRKAADAAALDLEARTLADALATDGGLDTVVTAGVAGPCPTCGTLVSTSARFCSTCGTALDRRPDAAPAAVDAAADATAATTEVPAANGDGATAGESELEPTAGGER
ncbi:MAG: zinc-ribbon domain-containing protein [Thermoleophilaceae bacterium]